MGLGRREVKVIDKCRASSSHFSLVLHRRKKKQNVTTTKMFTVLALLCYYLQLDGLHESVGTHGLDLLVKNPSKRWIRPLELLNKLLDRL